MKRTDLLSALKRAEPALAAKDLIPVFTCYKFDSNSVLAYNDVVAISTPCSFPVDGGLHGKPLLSWLANSRAKELTLDPGESEMLIKAGRSRIRLPLIPPDDFIFEFPDDAIAGIKPSPDLLQAIRACSASMGEDPAHPSRMGITVKFGKKEVNLWSSDNISASRSKAAAKIPGDLQGYELILAPRFVDLLLGIAKRDKLQGLIVGEGWVEADFDSGLRLWAKTMAEIDVEAFIQLFDSIYEQLEFEPVSIPKGLSASLDRLVVILDYGADKQARFTSDGKGKLRIVANSPVGEVKENLPFKEHPEVSELLMPHLIKRSLGYVGAMGIIPGCAAIFEGENFDYMVSIIAGAEED